MRVLIVESDALLAAHVAAAADLCGFAHDTVEDGSVGLARLETGRYQIACINVFTRQLDGFDLIRRARRKGIETHLLAFGEHERTSDRITGFIMGADDCLTLPVGRDELALRLQAIARRQNTLPPADPVSAEGLVVETDRLAVRLDGRKISLTPREMQILLLLLRRRNRPVSPGTIIEAVWDAPAACKPTTVFAHISHLRTKLHRPGVPDLIRTVSPCGYVFGK